MCPVTQDEEVPASKNHARGSQAWHLRVLPMLKLTLRWAIVIHWYASDYVPYSNNDGITVLRNSKTHKQFLCNRPHWCLHWPSSQWALLLRPIRANSRFDYVDQLSKLIKHEKIVKISHLIVISSRSLFLQLYKSGVYTGKCGTNLDHGVLAVIINVLEDAYQSVTPAKILNVSLTTS